MDLKAPDARVYGYLAWGRYSSIVPNGMYQTLDPATNGIGTGPFKLDGPYVPNDQHRLRQEPELLEAGAAVPGRDHVQGHHRRADAGRGAPRRLDPRRDRPADSAAALNGANGLTVLHGLTAAFRELQFTIKPGETKPWHDKRVRQAVSFAINRQNIIDKVYGGFGKYSGHVAAGYGPWPLSRGRAQDDVREVRPAQGEGADEAGRQLRAST